MLRGNQKGNFNILGRNQRNYFEDSEFLPFPTFLHYFAPAFGVEKSI